MNIRTNRCKSKGLKEVGYGSKQGWSINVPAIGRKKTNQIGIMKKKYCAAIMEGGQREDLKLSLPLVNNIV